MQTDAYIALEDRYCARNYQPLPVVLVRGSGAWVWDVAGRKYLDCLSCYSALSHGHCHPRIVQALVRQAAQLTLSSRAFYNDQLGPFLEELCALTQMDAAIPMNSGVEAVETAVKAARQWGYRAKNIPPNQAEIIVCAGNFHGRTTTVISFSTEEAYKRDFGPFTPGFRFVPYGDASALEAAITPFCCAFLVEPIQGEAGIVIPPDGWLKKSAEICRAHNVLFIADEIQSGLGRTGKLFACDHEDVRPDGIILGKALGGGVIPVSAFLAQRRVMDLFEPGSHGSTFGGNPLGAAVAREALRVLQDERLVERSRELGEYLMSRLSVLRNHPHVACLRGRGLWVALEIHPAYRTARAVCEELMQRGVLAKETHETTVRLAPPLTIQKEDLDWLVEQIIAVL
jgi:ornithine--oxo-acid transaminase